MPFLPARGGAAYGRLMMPPSPAPAGQPTFANVWEDAGRMLAANAGLLAAIAGVFLFLPAAIEARYYAAPALPIGSSAAEMADWQFLMGAYIRANWWWILLSSTAYFVGIVALYLLLLTPRITVGAAVAKAFGIMPLYIILAFIVGLAVFGGTMLLIVPGIFLMGKLVLSTPIMVAETPRSPFAAIRLSWARSTRPWWTAGLVILVYFAAAFVTLAIRIGLGTVILLLLGPDGVGGLLLALLQALMATAVAVLVILVTAALYRTQLPRA